MLLASGAALGLGAVVLGAQLNDGNWLRGVLETRATRAFGQQVRIGQAYATWQRGPLLILRDVSIGAERAPGPVLLRARALAFRPALRPLFLGRLHLAELALEGARIELQRDRAGHFNVKPPGSASSADAGARLPLWRRLPVDALVVEDTVVRVRDDVHALTLTARAEAPSPSERRTWHTRFSVKGVYRDSRIAVEALTGGMLTLGESGRPFPFVLRGSAGRTQFEAEGEIADLLEDPQFDAQVAIAGPSLSTLYPTLAVALPATPPYQLRGRLILKERLYRFESISGRIGRSDIGGTAQFDARGTRPRLHAELVSQRLALADLGAVIGAVVPVAAAPRVLPTAAFDLGRLRAMDATATLTARALIVRPELPLENLTLQLELQNGLMTIAPLRVGVAGGEMAGTIVLDGRGQPLQARIDADFRRIKLGRLFPTLDTARVSTGDIGAQVRLAGRGPAVADMLATADGTLMAALVGGRVSRTVIAAASLDGGRLLPLLLSGDAPVAVRCGAAIVAVRDGIGRTQSFVVDTDTALVRIEGAVDFRSETLALQIDTRPKSPSVLSLRAPLVVEGSWRDPRVAVSAGTLLRGGAALALGALNPLAALLPLIEVGPGDDADCAELLAEVTPAVSRATRPSPSRSGSKR